MLFLQTPGGVVGNVQSGGSVTYCYATGNITGTYTVGGVVAAISSNAVRSCVALNASLKTAGGTVRRVGWIYDGYSPSTNHGRGTGSTGTSGMTMYYLNTQTYSPTTASAVHNATDGATTTNYNTSGFWTTASNWYNSVAWDTTNTWEWSTNKLILRNMPGATQNHTVPQ